MKLKPVLDEVWTERPIKSVGSVACWWHSDFDEITKRHRAARIGSICGVVLALLLWVSLAILAVTVLMGGR